jgi:hypothetical protein
MTVIWKFLHLSWVRDIEFWEVIVIEILIKIQQMILQGNLSCTMSSHLGQVHRLHYVSMKECS